MVRTFGFAAGGRGGLAPAHLDVVEPGVTLVDFDVGDRVPQNAAGCSGILVLNHVTDHDRRSDVEEPLLRLNVPGDLLPSLGPGPEALDQRDLA